MKRIIGLSLLALLVNLTVNAQAVLPSTWGFPTTVLPTGWSISGATTYYGASGSPAPSMKFADAGDMLIINFGSSPGNLTYDMKANLSPSSPWSGTFVVEESTNGSSWTTLHTYINPSATTVSMTDVPNVASRYVRFNFLVNVSGNISLDNVSILAGAPTSAQEINVQYASATIFTGNSISTNSPVSTLLPITFSIQNLGTSNALNISSVAITGANAADYTVGTAPTAIAATTNSNLVINFTPSASGTRTGIITINSDDADESAYVIAINGVGGSFATEPAAQPTNLVFSNVKTYRFSGAFTAASGVDGYIVLRKLGSAITDAPVDGVIYQRGDAIGATKVVYSNSAASFVPNNIIAGSNYYFAVFAYNGVGAARNYLQTSPLTANVTTPATMMSVSEYATISTASATFKSDLHALIYPHTTQFYSSYGPFMVPLFEARDTTGDQRVITCVYSGENKMYIEPFDWTTAGYSREHTYCHNWMPSNPADAPERPEYADYHHLFPTNQDNANVLRSNYPLGVVVGTPTTTYLGCKFGNDVNGNKVFEPRNEQKGDAARAIMYLAVCYDAVDGFNWSLRNPISSSINYGQDQDVLKAWHFQDPPSNWEIARNDYIDSIQGNRNPFIDSIQYACFIDFTTMGKIATGCTAGTGLEEVLDNSLAIYPVPSRDVVFIKIEGTIISSYEVMDMQSRIVKTENEINSSFVTMNASGLKAGTYLVKVSTPKGNVIRKMIIE